MYALEQGKTLIRRYTGDLVETIRMERTPTGYRQYIRTGWCSKVGTVDDVLKEISTSPELWQIKSIDTK
jgi:hypothetical protein